MFVRTSLVPFGTSPSVVTQKSQKHSPERTQKTFPQDPGLDSAEIKCHFQYEMFGPKIRSRFEPRGGGAAAHTDPPEFASAVRRRALS